MSASNVEEYNRQYYLAHRDEILKKRQENHAQKKKVKEYNDIYKFIPIWFERLLLEEAELDETDPDHTRFPEKWKSLESMQEYVATIWAIFDTAAGIKRPEELSEEAKAILVKLLEESNK